MSILTISKFAPSTLERALFTFTIVNFEKVKKSEYPASMKEGFFFFNSSYPGCSGNDIWLKWLGLQVEG